MYITGGTSTFTSCEISSNTADGVSAEGVSARSIPSLSNAPLDASGRELRAVSVLLVARREVACIFMAEQARSRRAISRQTQQTMR